MISTIMTTTIENRELKGITARLILTIVISTATIVSGGFGAYYGLKSDIQEVKSQNEVKKVEFQALKVQVDAIQVQLNQMQNKQNYPNGK